MKAKPPMQAVVWLLFLLLARDCTPREISSGNEKAAENKQQPQPQQQQQQPKQENKKESKKDTKIAAESYVFTTKTSDNDRSSDVDVAADEHFGPASRFHRFAGASGSGSHLYFPSFNYPTKYRLDTFSSVLGDKNDFDFSDNFKPPDSGEFDTGDDLSSHRDGTHEHNHHRHHHHHHDEHEHGGEHGEHGEEGEKSSEGHESKSEHENSKGYKRRNSIKPIKRKRRRKRRAASSRLKRARTSRIWTRPRRSSPRRRKPRRPRASITRAQRATKKAPRRRATTTSTTRTSTRRTQSSTTTSTTSTRSTSTRTRTSSTSRPRPSTSAWSTWTRRTSRARPRGRATSPTVTSTGAPRDTPRRWAPASTAARSRRAPRSTPRPVAAAASRTLLVNRDYLLFDRLVNVSTDSTSCTRNRAIVIDKSARSRLPKRISSLRDELAFVCSRLLRGHTLLASPPELDIFFRTRCLVPSCECGSRFCRRWQVPSLLCRLHLVSVVLASGATL
ncbi:unnamed protein product [Trichogramma brassicae]|uniref:Uncharacterized protein n=1 Tax=Trichogramma brassicae TaxID=86971 RepID=A0A6H5IH16_9HYME|nr:unnamed protein product [Trichogramma brassicae]